jgi:N-acetylglutamate synthase-like GNAT family acetyltransferase
MIRQFQPEDAEACCDLVHACIQYDLELSQAQRLALLHAESPQSMRERSKLFYLAVYESEGAVAGLGGLDMNEVRMLFVSPACQRRGIGKAILEFLEAMVPPALFREVFVYAALSAASFYRARGYSEHGEHYFDWSGQRLTTIFMTKKIQ